MGDVQLKTELATRKLVWKLPWQSKPGALRMLIWGWPWVAEKRVWREVTGLYAHLRVGAIREKGIEDC